MKYIIAISVAICLSGCGMFRAETQTQAHTVTAISGTVEGKAVNLQMDAHEQGSSSSDISLNTDTIMGWASFVLGNLGGGTGIMAIIMAFREKQKADYHMKDATEGWQNYKDEVSKP